MNRASKIKNGQGEGIRIGGCDKIGNMDHKDMDKISDMDQKDVDNIK